MPDVRREQNEKTVAFDDPYDDAPLGYFTTDPEGIVQRANRTFIEWTGYAAEEVIGKRRFADFLTAGGRIFLDTHFAPSLHLHGRMDEVAFEVVCRDGTRFSALVNAVQRRDADSGGLFNRITIFKATERRRYEQELLLARREAEQMAKDLVRTVAKLSLANDALDRTNQELSQFAHAASHDLQAPLRSMKMFADLLQRRYGQELDPLAMTYLQRIDEGAGVMERLIIDLLALSQAGGATTAHHAVDVNEVVHEILVLLAADIAASAAVITCEPLPTLVIDRRQIRQLIQNLLANALKYRQADRVPRITISAALCDGSWKFSVGDNGCGFAMDDADRIFTPFKRLHGAEVPGTGIGLALCRKVVESHGGKIWAESYIGEGSTFFFTLTSDNARL